MTGIRERIQEVKGRLENIKPPMPWFMYDDITGSFPRDEIGFAHGESCLNVLKNHLSTEIDQIENLLSEVETRATSIEERLDDALTMIEKLHGAHEQIFEEIKAEIEQLGLEKRVETRAHLNKLHEFLKFIKYSR